MEATTGSQIDFKNPYWLRSIGGFVEVAKVRPKESDDGNGEFDRLIAGAKDAIHSIVNNTCRAAGVEVGDADSEMTWDWVTKFGVTVEAYIRREWKRQDYEDDARKREENDTRLLDQYLVRVNEARRARGLPQYVLTTPSANDARTTGD